MNKRIPFKRFEIFGSQFGRVDCRAISGSLHKKRAEDVLMEKLQVAYNKTLKLKNACIYHVQEADINDLNKIVFQMESYIRSKGALPLGPVIQFSQVEIGETGEAEVTIKLIRQANMYIVHTEPPYTMESVLRCQNCLFCRFHGDDSQLHFAYDKLNLISFEEDIPLTGRAYTIFTSQSKDVFVADIFMETKAD